MGSTWALTVASPGHGLSESQFRFYAESKEAEGCGLSRRVWERADTWAQCFCFKASKCPNARSFPPHPHLSLGGPTLAPAGGAAPAPTSRLSSSPALTMQLTSVQGPSLALSPFPSAYLPPVLRGADVYYNGGKRNQQNPTQLIGRTPVCSWHFNNT